MTERIPARVVLTGGIFALAMGLFVLCFLKPWPAIKSEARGQQSNPTAQSMRTGTEVQTAAITLIPPGPPPVAKVAQRPAGAVFDPFAGGPTPKKPKTVKVAVEPPPPRLVVYAMPVSYIYQKPTGREVYYPFPISPAPFRYAGLLFNSGVGQVTAIVEDRAGRSRAVSVGETVEGWQVRGIGYDSLTLADAHGRVWSMQKSGHGDYSYRTRWQPCR